MRKKPPPPKVSVPNIPGSYFDRINSERDNFDHWAVLADAAMENDDFRLALSAQAEMERLAEQTDSDTWLVETFLSRFDYHDRQGNYHEAAQAWQAAAGINEQINETIEVLLQMFLMADMLDEAQDYTDSEWLSKPVADYYRASIAHRRGDPVRATYLWRQIANTNLEDFPEALVVRATAMCWIGQPLQALSLLLEDHRRRSADWDHILHTSLVMALAWAIQGDLATAQANLKTALSSFDAPHERLGALDWYEFEQLVQDETIKAELRPFFELDDQ
ncbi:MAG: hypothetical protein U9R25_12520 [Chloroflexota bacterium]|nr:hypothetical protein [Chloroflexota bacterium]